VEDGHGLDDVLDGVDPVVRVKRVAPSQPCPALVVGDVTDRVRGRSSSHGFIVSVPTDTMG
jgi:hypothetical protein